MNEACVINGVGLITPLGIGLDATWRAMTDGAFVVDAGVVPLARDSTIDRVSQLGLAALREAVGVDAI